MNRIEISKVPVWRKVFFVICFCVTMFVGLIAFTKEAGVYASGARTPSSKTAETYPVSVNHGYIRYLTREEHDNLAFWRAFVGMPLLAGILVMVTSREFWRAVHDASR
jgi:hypothetical protein